MNKFSKILHKLSDITRIHHRAAFADVEHRISQTTSPFLKLASDRYSCRGFAGKAVSAQDIAMITEAARLAPSATNRQPVHIWVAKSAEALEKLKETTPYTYGAPVVFIIGYRKEDAWVRKYDGKDSAETDAAIACTHMMLEAADLGLASVWVGSFNPSKLRELLPETADYEVLALLPVGYADAAPGHNHEKRKDMEVLVSEL